MSGLLEIEIGGATPGDGLAGYDQILVVGSEHAITCLLDGDLALSWSGAGWSSACDRLWIIRNDTDGTLTGTFHDYRQRRGGRRLSTGDLGESITASMSTHRPGNSSRATTWC